MNQLDLSGLDGYKVSAWVWLEASRFLQVDQTRAGSASKLLCFFEIEPRLEVKHRGLFRGRCRVGFAGSRPLISSNRLTGGPPENFKTRDAAAPRLGYLTGFSPDTCAAHSCLWDWELRSYLACRLRCIRPARRVRVKAFGFCLQSCRFDGPPQSVVVTMRDRRDDY